MKIKLRPYTSSDCGQIAELFYQTVHSVNAGDYPEEQLAAWATGDIDLEAWDRSFKEHHTVVATKGDEIVGFGDIDSAGYLDRLYVHKDHQRDGIATAICDELEGFAGPGRITTQASITARPFFEKRGFTVIREQTVNRGGVSLTNYLMEKVAKM